MKGETGRVGPDVDDGRPGLKGDIRLNGPHPSRLNVLNSVAHQLAVNSNSRHPCSAENRQRGPKGTETG
ncbi:hypothetical protein RvY_11583 [Ramazzottius varieornatus]|uniref:Uncharacterized protein n=1 Tax=Ramazzottius varieornatus TaxID=947166 RepID=A0A1D1VKX6_RAMVA|nr:hypothetical protein RvY_11583 [Ramazzottius varieornatus]